MLYILDANVLITASNLYYRVDAVAEFWAWLAHQCAVGNIKMPIETFEEVKDGGSDVQQDLLFEWIQANKATLLLDEESDPDLVRRDMLRYVCNASGAAFLNQLASLTIPATEWLQRSLCEAETFLYQLSSAMGNVQQISAVALTHGFSANHVLRNEGDQHCVRPPASTRSDRTRLFFRLGSCAPFEASVWRIRNSATNRHRPP